jgi:tetratricopeptide (TPR) repeat protein
MQGATGVRRYLLISMLAVSCAAITASTRWLSAERAGSDPSRIKEVLLLPPGQVLRQIDLGYHSLTADLLFIKANLYYGEKMYADQETPWLSGFISSLIEVDPDFKNTYLWGALVTTYYKRQIDDVPLELVERANRILEAGMRRFPDDYRFPMRIAFNFYYEMSDADAALPYFERASQIPNAPRWIKEKLVDIYSKKGRTELASTTIKDMLLGTEDPTLIKTLQNRLQLLLTKDDSKDFISQQQTLISDWKQRYAYLSFDLYLLIREP